MAFEVLTADVDEPALRAELRAGNAAIEPREVAAALARAKAEEVSRRQPEALVIGADQILELDGEIFAKPVDKPAAREQLLRLSGRTHELHSAVALALGGAVAWSETSTARLTVRPLGTVFLDHYLASAGERVLASVGGYELEGLGVHLFERVEGDYFTILGLPLLPLLAELRRRGAIAA